jgi:pilus assembly protein CpaB
MDRQKILMIFGGAWLSAALLTWFVYSTAASARTEKLTSVYAAARDLPAGTRLRQKDIKRINLPQSTMPRAAVLDEKLAVDRVVLHPVSMNEPLVTTKLTSTYGADGVAAMIDPGKRAISVPVTDISSAGGLIQPRSRVDVLFTRTGSMREALTTTILQDVVVISIGKLTEIGQQLDPKAIRPMTQAATLMVTPDEANKLELAKNQGKISLVLRNPLDKSTIDAASVTAESLDPNIFAGASRAIRSSMIAGGKIPDVRDDQVWAQITNGQAPGPGAGEKRPPSRPKLIVDVYRGDKHVQETFQ